MMKTLSIVFLTFFVSVRGQNGNTQPFRSKCENEDSMGKIISESDKNWSLNRKDIAEILKL